jgi:hypothetical protein
MSVTTRNIAITFDTVSDMINDKDIKLGMVVQTLGKNSVNDNYGATYKIVSNPDGNVGTNNYALKKKPLLKAIRINSTSVEERIKTSESSITNLKAGVSEINERLTGIVNCEVYGEIKALSAGIKIVSLTNGQKAIIVTDVVAPAEAAIATLELNDEDYDTLLSPGPTEEQESNEGTEVVEPEEIPEEPVGEESTEPEKEPETPEEETTEPEEVEVSEPDMSAVPMMLSDEGIEPITEEEIIDDDNVTVSLTDNIATVSFIATKDRAWAIPTTLELLSDKISEVYLNDNCAIKYTSSTVRITVNRQLNPAIYYYI